MHHIVRLTWVWIPLQSIIYSACPVPVCQFISGTELCNLLSRQSMTWSSYWPRQCMSLPICHWTSSTTVWLICTTLTAGRVSCSDVCVNLLVFFCCHYGNYSTDLFRTAVPTVTVLFCLFTVRNGHLSYPRWIQSFSHTVAMMVIQPVNVHCFQHVAHEYTK